MSFDMFLLAVESRDLSQADKNLIRASSFQNCLIFSNHFYSDPPSRTTKSQIPHLNFFFLSGIDGTCLVSLYFQCTDEVVTKRSIVVQQKRPSLPMDIFILDS